MSDSPRTWLPLSVVIPVKNGGQLFQQTVRHLRERLKDYDFEVVIVDSGSTDGSLELVKAAGPAFQVHEISPTEFGHGKTRNLAAQLATREILSFLTHDVLPCTRDWPEIFVKAFEDPTVAGVYGRQIPRNAPSIEMYFVSLNYPPEPIRYRPGTGNPNPRPGRVLFSDAFSALRRDLLLASPHPVDVRVSEDQLFARRMLSEGYQILYEPRAEAFHAHRYTLKGLWHRTYPTAYALAEAGLANGATFRESVGFLLDEIKWFARHGHSHKLPWLLTYEFVRWASFQAGRYMGSRSTADRSREKRPMTAELPDKTDPAADQIPPPPSSKTRDHLAQNT